MRVLFEWSLMWVLRRFKNPLLACCLLLVVLSLTYRFTNVFDVLFFITSKESCNNLSCFNYFSTANESDTDQHELPLSLHCNLGRLGNQMCTYATLIGISALNHRQRIVPLSCNVKHLTGIFVGPSRLQSINEIMYTKLNPWKLVSYLRPEDAAIPRNCNFLEGYKYPCSYTFFDHARDEVRRHFQFEEHLVRHAQDVLHKANVQGQNNVTFVGVHVRRGDYMKGWLQVYDGVPVNEAFFREAVRYFRDKYGEKVIFVAISDDRLWCIKHLSSQFGMYVPADAPSPAHDLALLAHCNHSVLSYGTFGFWGAYLAGGEVLYFDKFLRPNTTFTREKFIFEKMYPPRWKGIVTVNESEAFPPLNRTVKHQDVTIVNF